MKQFLFIFLFFALSFSGVQAQSNVETQKPELKVEVIKTEKASTTKEVAAKKKDILNTKISLKLKGEAGLFIIKEKRIAC
ncbi:hypothetical protein [Hanstruepera ponticola]|uniref:hypothetical protein n=1 Tax=Hanstruepera ponticola TaxID=2042995 RepID=UPI0013C5055C|nr:hypothetical protein [Hanstruepera ponticola]